MDNEHAQPLRRIEWRGRVLAAGGAPFLLALVQRGYREETLDDRHDRTFEAWLRGETVEAAAPGEVERLPEHAEQWAELDTMRATETRLSSAARLLGVPVDAVPMVIERLRAASEAVRVEAEALRARAKGSTLPEALTLIDALSRRP